MSRPRKIPGSKSVQVSFLLSESEYQAVKQAATLSNVSMSEWIRGATNAALKVSIDQRKAMMKLNGRKH
jgi:uncharacterized protein (DUF1778 family)